MLKKQRLPLSPSKNAMLVAQNRTKGGLLDCVAIHLAKPVHKSIRKATFCKMFAVMPGFTGVEKKLLLLLLLPMLHVSSVQCRLCFLCACFSVISFRSSISVCVFVRSHCTYHIFLLLDFLPACFGFRNNIQCL